jgi:hypothetical protein
MTTRAVWARFLAGSYRGSEYYYLTTDASVTPQFLATAVPTGATVVPLMLLDTPSVSSGALEPLATVAADTTLTLRVGASAGALALVAPDLAVGASVRRVGFLTTYAEPSDTVLGFFAEGTVAPGDLLCIAGELVEVDSVGTGTLTVTRAQCGTWARALPAALADPSPVMQAARIPLRGQWVEYGVTDDGVDTVLWRGVAEKPSSGTDQVVTISCRSLMAVARDQRMVVPTGSELATSVYTDGETTSAFLSFVVDEEAYPWAKWEYVRIVGRSGDWAILDLSTLDNVGTDDQFPRIVLGLTPDFEAPIIGTGDGVIRVASPNQTIRVRSASGSIVTRTVYVNEQVRREHAIGVFSELTAVEWCDIDTAVTVEALTTRLLTGSDLPPTFGAHFPPSWMRVFTVAAAQVQYQAATDILSFPVIASRGSLLDFIAGALLRPSALFLSADLGALVLDTWIETARAMAAVSVESGPSRSPVAWAQSTRPIFAILIDDPSQDVELQRAYTLGFGSRGSLAIRNGRDRSITNTTNQRKIVSADAYLSNQRYVETIGAPFGLSPSQDAALQSVVGTYGRELPSITAATSETLTRMIGTAIDVELPDLPVTRALLGIVYEVTRSPGVALLTSTILLPGVGRDTLTLWAPSVTLGAVDTNDATAEGPDLELFSAFVGGELVVYAPTGEVRATLTGTGWTAPDVLTWTTATDPPLSGDIVTLADRTPVVAPVGVDGVIAYVADVAIADGDGIWQ